MITNGGLLLLLVFIPFAGSIVVAFFRSNAHNVEAIFASAVAIAALSLAVLLYSGVAGGGVVREEIAWLPAYGLNFGLRMDGFAWMFAILVTGMGLLVIIYARYYMSPADPVPRFFCFFLAFMGSMLGLVLSGNLVLLAIFWELTGIFSFLLIGYWYQNAGARDGARMALIVTGVGGIALLLGILIIGHIVGSYELDQVLASSGIIRRNPLFLPVILLILLGALTKSAQFPFQFWLPNAMSAPTPVSAYLHSATLVMAGVFLLAQLWPVFSGTREWFWILGIAGLASLILGAWFALFQQDLKGLLAYSTISHLGLITVLLSLGSPLAAVAAIFHMFNHAIFKASLFMAAGIIDHETGTRDMRRLGGLFRFMPITATLAMVASAAMAGVPLLNGFISKEMFFAEAVETHRDNILDIVTPYLAILAGIFSVAYSTRFIHCVFFGPPRRDLPRDPHEPPHWMYIPIAFLVLACLVIGIFPARSVGPYLRTAAIGVLGIETPPYSLAIWHGFNLPMLMSAIALAVGVALYFLLENYLATSENGPPWFRHISGRRIFDRVLVTISWRWARLARSWAGTRRLQPQLRLLVLIGVVAGALPFYHADASAGTVPMLPVDPVFVALWLLGGICAVGAAMNATFHRLAALVMLGCAGLVVCITFAWASAPDLAMTQLLVEIVTMVLILLGLRWLPKRPEGLEKMPMETGPRMRRLRDFLLAVAGGGGMAFLAYAVMTRPDTRNIGDYFVRYAYTEGGGRNVVNVILVDFRGLDTFGEIAVLGVVALSVFALLRRFRPAAESIGAPLQQHIQDASDEARADRRPGDTLSDYLAVPSVIMQWLFPVIVVFAIYLFLRGHDLPGGGFAAGVALAIGFILQYLAAGTRWVESHMRILPLRWIATGLLIAASTGMGSWAFGYPFLTSRFEYANLPLIGKVPMASALLFDLGVFLLVIGATVLVLIALAHQSIRRHRAVSGEER
ncbi:monovalent cation/H+ antiporter subunit A [Phyllobacterium leguminum]|uniref:Multisubunit potassium/proton antiporter PhaA subunit /multisubunit potassium/proton antiporter PhaB subunit n=1 Tax=Phyllobacterium leguminum TaxID=314237 RepID=A0A318T7E4_9HYPH|nr:monovalent cation/H+ antiporter subunit A [Phyllobacterium leguminum]PYE90511.1 multisubunit potassium/proton antiporter PhaA subunit /multisubunit potassium/proton antiporter PhaB subunit [Phyllobacterium leguminum]